MPSLNLDLDYFDHPKTVRLVCLLGRGAAELPLKLWAYCGKYHRDDGFLAAYTPEMIAAAVRWQGEPQKLVTALLECGAHIGKKGFLEQTEGGYQVHDWDEHEGHLVRYHRAAKIGGKARWEAERAKRNADRIPDRNADRIPDRIPDRNASPVQCSTESRSRARGQDLDLVPTLEEARTEAQAQGYRCDPDRWFHKSKAAGWLDSSGCPIRDWKAALAAWERLEGQMPSRNGNGSKPASPVDSERRKQKEQERLEWNRKVAAEVRAAALADIERAKGAAHQAVEETGRE